MKTVPSIPEDAYNFLKLFKKCFSKPQFQNFVRYEMGLVCCENKTIDHMNEQFVGSVNQSTLNRFVTCSPWDNTKVKDKYYSMIKPHVKGYRSLLVDDTLAHKTGEHMEGVGIHYDHLMDSHCLGHSVVTAMLHTNKMALPIIPELYIREEDCAKAEFITKIELAIHMILDMHRRFGVNLVINDSWYTCNELVNTCKHNEIVLIGGIKCNRTLSIGGQKRTSAEKYKQSLHYKDYTQIVLNGRTFRFHERKVYLRGIGMVKLIISQARKSKKWSNTWYIICSNKEWSGKTILTLYLKRSKIEAFHRDSKQHLGFEAYQLRKQTGIIRHLMLCIIAYAMLKLLASVKNVRWTIGQVCRYIVNTIYHIMFKWLLSHFGVEQHLNLIRTAFIPDA